MGNDCFSRSVKKEYGQYFESAGNSSLKEMWETVKLYKIKTIFDRSATQNDGKALLDFESFVSIFSEFVQYHSAQLKRIFEFFDQENLGGIDWYSFHAGVSYCYFGSEKVLATIMFMAFDTVLEKQLEEQELTLLVDLNSRYIRINTESENNSPLYEPEEVVEELANIRLPLTLDVWLQTADRYFDFSKYRGFFSLFTSQKLEKELVANFQYWNQILDEEKGKYVSYLVNFKWFQSWRMYILENYGKSIEIYRNKKQSQPTFRTNCSLKTLRKGLSTTKCISKPESPGYRVLKVNYIDDDYTSTNFDLVHSNIGERPREINNSLLEDQYREMLRPEVSENRDYVLVSETVWTHLKKIYQGAPEFRRTGFDMIELHPKMVKVYSNLVQGELDISSDIIREVSGFLPVNELLMNILAAEAGALRRYHIYFKTIGMQRWILVKNTNTLLTELTTESIIFLACIDKQRNEEFTKRHLRVARTIADINVGDSLKYTDAETGQIRCAILLGRTKEGKYMIHFEHQSYEKDILLPQEDLLRSCELSPALSSLDEGGNKTEADQPGMPAVRGMGFINAVIIQLLNYRPFKEQLALLSNGHQSAVKILAHVDKLLCQKKQIELNEIREMIEDYAPAFVYFDVSMAAKFMDQFLIILSGDMKALNMRNIFGEQCSVAFKKHQECHGCGKKTEETLSWHLMYLSIPAPAQLNFEVVFVPASDNPRSDIKRFGFKVPIGSTFKAYCQEFERMALASGQMTARGCLSPQYILAEVYGNDIVKNYSSVSETSTLEQLKLRESDAIYAYELTVDFSGFVSQHYNLQELEEDKVKVGQLIDCRNQERGWLSGRVLEVNYFQYTHSFVVKVEHHTGRNEVWESNFNMFEDCVSRFPLNSFRNCEQYHLRVRQSIFSEASNDMHLCHIPLVVVLTSWMRWREFSFQMYRLLKKFIAEPYLFSNDQDESFAMGNSHIKTETFRSDRNMRSKSRKVTRKEVEQMKVDKFKEYMNSDRFPYKLLLANFEGRCAVCFKFLKGTVSRSESEIYCVGCPLASGSEPISWQAKPADLVVYVMWKDTLRLKKDVIFNHSSYLNLLGSKHKGNETIESCMAYTAEKHTEDYELPCCNEIAPKSYSSVAIAAGDLLPIYLERIVQEPDGFKRIIHTHVQIDFEGVVILGKTYNLVGLISIEGQNSNINYKAYVCSEDGLWHQHERGRVRIVDKKVVKAACALALYYREQVNKPMPQIDKNNTHNNAHATAHKSVSTHSVSDNPLADTTLHPQTTLPPSTPVNTEK